MPIGFHVQDFLITNINYLSFFVYKGFKSTHFNKFWKATGTVHCCCSVLLSSYCSM